MDDEDIFISEKFEDCSECKHRFSCNICEWCDVGEEFEPDDMEEVDAHFKGRF
jgi:hypothetical protein